MVKKYTFEELLDLSYGEYPWWTIRAKDSERTFYTAVHYQMMVNMCLNNEYHPDYAGGVVDNFSFKYYENAHDLIYWKTFGSGPKVEHYLSTYRDGPRDEE